MASNLISLPAVFPPDIYMVMFTRLLRRFFSFVLNFSRSSSLGRPSLKSPLLYQQTLSPCQVFSSLALITTYSIWLTNINFNFLLSPATTPSPNWNVNFRKLEVYFLIFVLIPPKYSDPQTTPGYSSHIKNIYWIWNNRYLSFLPLTCGRPILY